MSNVPASPCQGVCRLEGQTCVGCGRLIGETVEWPSATVARKHLIIHEAATRLAIIKLELTYGSKLQ